MKSFFEPATDDRQRKTHEKIEQGRQEIDLQRLERGVADNLGCARQFGDAHNGSERCILDEHHKKADGWRRRNLYRLRNDDEAHGIDAAKPQCMRSFALPHGHRIDGTTPNLPRKAAA